MARYAELYDGRKLEFPDDTPDDIIAKVARQQTLGGTEPEVASTREPQATADTFVSAAPSPTPAQQAAGPSPAASLRRPSPKGEPDPDTAPLSESLASYWDRFALSLSAISPQTGYAVKEGELQGLKDTVSAGEKRIASREASFGPKFSGAEGYMKYNLEQDRKKLLEEEPELTKEVANWRRQVDEFSQARLAATPKNESFLGEAGGTVVESSPAILMGYLTLAVTGNPALAIQVGSVAGFQQEGVSAYSEARQAGAPIDRAQATGVINALIEKYADKLQLKALSQEGKAMLSKIFSAIKISGPSEMAAEAGQAANEFVQYNDKMTVKDVLHRIAIAGVAGTGTAVVATPAFELVQQRQAARRFELETQDAMTRHLAVMDTPEMRALEALDPGAKRVDPMAQEGVVSTPPVVAGVEPAAVPLQPAFDLGITDPKRIEIDQTIPAAEQVQSAFARSPEHAAAVAIARSQEEGFQPVKMLDNELSQISPSLKERYLTALKEGFKTQAEALTEELKQRAKASDEAAQKIPDSVTPATDTKKALKSLKKVQLMASKEAGGNFAEWLKTLIDVVDNSELMAVVRGLGETAKTQTTNPVVAQVYVREGLGRYTELLEGQASGIHNPFGYVQSSGVPYLKNQSEGGMDAQLYQEDDKPVEVDNEPIWKKKQGKESLLSAATKAQKLQQTRGKVWSARKAGAIISDQGQQVAVDVLSRWLKKFPGINIVLILGPFQGSGRYGFTVADSTPIGKDTVQIRINTSLDEHLDLRGMPTPLFFENLAHELGHGLAEHILSRATPMTQQAIYNAYNLWLYEQLKKTSAESYRGSRGTIRTLMVGELSSIDAVQAKILAYVINPELNKTDAKYAFGFAEWLAHQMEQRLSTREMQAPIRAYIRKVYDVYKRVWAATKDQYKPSQTFAQFLAYGKAMVLEQNAMIKQALIEGFIAEIGARPGSLPPATAPPSNPTETVREQRQAARDAAGVAPRQAAQTIWRNIRVAMGPNPHASGFDAHLDNFNQMKRWTAGLLQIARTHRHIKELTDPMGVIDPQTGEVRHGFVDYILKWNALRMNWMSRTDERQKEWRKLDSWFNHKQSTILAAFMLEQTHAGKYFDLTDPAVQRQYPMLPETLALFKRIDEDFKAYISAVEETLLRETAVRMRNNPFLQNELQGIRNKFTDLRSRPYFPLTRFGDYTIIVKATQATTVLGKTFNAGDTIHFEAFDSKWERWLAYKKIQRAFPTGELKQDMMSESLQTMSGMPRAMLEALKDILNLTPEQKKELDEYLYRTAPGHNFVRHMVQRKGISGFSYDVKRAHADYFLHGSNHLARLTYYQALHESIERLGKTATAIQGDATTRRELQNFLRRHFDYLMNPQEDWTKARGTIAVLYLGLVMKTALVNMTQVMMTYAHLSPTYGDKRATAAIAQAYVDLPKIYAATKTLNAWQQEAITRSVQGMTLNPTQERFVTAWTGFNQLEREALERALKEGFIDQSFAMELAAMGASSWLNKFQAGSEIGYRIRQVTSGVMIPFQAVEKMNRRIAFISSFRLAREDGANFENAYVLARDSVSQTQYEYGKWNRPELLRGRKGILLMFMQYQLTTLWFMCGADSGWWRVWALMLFSAGMLGLPGVGNFIDLAEWAYQRWKPNNPAFIKAQLKKELGEFLNPGSADLILHGASRYGFGFLPWADLSGSMSLGKPIPATNVVFGNTGILSSVSRDWDSLATDLVTEGGGAFTGLFMRMIQFMASNDPDQWSRIQRGMPTTFGQQVMGAFQWYDRGGVETGTGAKVKQFDLTDPWDLLEVSGMALGIQPRSVSNAREDAYYAQESQRYFALRREMLLTSLYDRKRFHDVKGSEIVMQEILKYNKQVPWPILKMGPETIKRSLMQRMKGKAMTENVGGDTKEEIMIKRMLRPQPAVLPPDTPR